MPLHADRLGISMPLQRRVARTLSGPSRRDDPAEGEAAEDRRGLSRRAILVGLVVGLPISGLFLYLAAHGLDLGAVLDLIGAAHLAPLLGAVLALMLVYLVQSERWRLIARPLGTARRRSFFAMVLAGLAANNVVPGRPGEFLRAYWLGRMVSVRGGRALATVVLDRATDFLALLVLLSVTLPFVPHPAWLRALYLLVVAVAAALVLAIAAAWLYARSARGRRPRSGARSLVARQASAFVRGLATPLRPGALLAAAGLSALAWTIWAGAAWLVAASLGIALSPVQIGFVAAVINLGSSIPSSPGFVGTYQWLGVASLGLFGVTQEAGFAFAVLLHAAWFIPVTLVGLSLAGWWSLAGRRPGESRGGARRSGRGVPPIRVATSTAERPIS